MDRFTSLNYRVYHKKTKQTKAINKKQRKNPNFTEVPLTD